MPFDLASIRAECDSAPWSGRVKIRPQLNDRRASGPAQETDICFPQKTERAADRSPKHERVPKMACRRDPSLGARDTRSAPGGLRGTVEVRTPSVFSPIAVDWNTEPLIRRT
jgi:hypothetical protein